MAVVEGWVGRYFEDFQVGDVYRSSAGRTVNETDNVWFTLVTNNTNQLHFNREAAKQAGMPDCIVNSLFTLAVVVGLTVPDVSANGINLGWRDVSMPSPVFAGDTLYAQTEVLEKRESGSRPHMGIVTVHTEGLNQRGVPVVRYVRSVMVWKRGKDGGARSFPEKRDDGSDSRLSLDT